MDDRFRAFFSKSVAQDSPELENAAYENEKKRRGPGKWKRLLQNAVNDHEEEFITGEYDTLLPTKAHRSEKGGKTRVQVQPDEPQVTESGTTLHGFTISMELDAPEAAPEGMPLSLIHICPREAVEFALAAGIRRRAPAGAGGVGPARRRGPRAVQRGRDDGGCVRADAQGGGGLRRGV